MTVGPGIETQGKGIRRRNSAKGASRREAILAAAMHRFSRDGYQSAAIADVAKDVGLSLPGLLHHFPTKVDLLLAILDKRDLESSVAIDVGQANWHAFLLGLIQIAKYNTSIPEVVRAFAILNAESLTQNHPAKAWFSDRARQLQANIATKLTDGVLRGEVKRDVDCPAIAAEVIAMMDGLQMLWLRDPTSFDMVGAIAGYIGRLIMDLQASPATQV
ncbi:TetR/AcrR family transcriptional regulator [Agrobacterium sp. SHOUNA12C]|uniref:Transcriptional regulator protein n=2 Tax=Rhizobium rhizogenes TaxID=359 RepID=B9JLI9_RHIR8|nr:TetR/AcrR family transcriptional regulator [Rhizobium rhizogenes]ACM30725.1 transcriptional regulator protein [Rhizobium rhizogenes K84]MCJ9721060.1 TetR/AcrR family transcriptional regulator [Agrobacterium sp. BETTINA12B]MCJ9755817.1 TetR/AcrR family transcriptional regulator [Agrobacterium sp. SHOUNA12C]OCJ16063.1 TetR family transcriptional regulator [Agrobacterium sp. B131/95]MDJ1636942.1 TetR/AcrR family transcriptional regulator [Rhizobium rhizogenes]